MNKDLFRIKNLECAYQKNKTVLRIEDLTIPTGKLIILLGKSGSGKSTFLETLGLMNHTISSGDVLFYPDGLTSPISYSSLWETRNHIQLAKIRHDHFSFIFQSTNLMPNFSAFENACLTELIKGSSFEETRVKITNLMAALGLKEIDQTRKASELSGGQKQRIAFIRAMASKFDVLFGDEPTGNLDEFNSRELIDFLKSNLINSGKSSIIVTHNISLAMEFGDMIILLGNEINSTHFCEIDPSYIFNRSEEQEFWKNHSSASISSEELGQKIQMVLK